MTFEQWLAEKGQQAASALGGGTLNKPNIKVPAPAPDTKEQLAEYWRQNVSNPAAAPQQASPPFPPMPVEEAPPPPSPRPFNKVKQSLQPKQITSQDIRATVSATEPLTDDQMAELDRSRAQR